MPASSDSSPGNVSVENQGLLVRLGDSVQALSQGVNDFIQTQRQENVRIHARIDQTAATGAEQVGEIKDLISARGRVSGQSILSLIAVLVSVCAFFAGFGHAYVGMRLENLNPRLDANASGLRALESKIESTREDLIKSRVEAAFNAGQASARFDELYRHAPSPVSVPVR